MSLAAGAAFATRLKFWMELLYVLVRTYHSVRKRKGNGIFSFILEPYLNFRTEWYGRSIVFHIRQQRYVRIWSVLVTLFTDDFRCCEMVIARRAAVFMSNTVMKTRRPFFHVVIFYVQLYHKPLTHQNRVNSWRKYPAGYVSDSNAVCIAVCATFLAEGLTHIDSLYCQTVLP